MFERRTKQERGPWWRNMYNFEWGDHRSFQKKAIKQGKVPCCYLVDERRAEGPASLHRSKNIQENCGTGAMWVWDATHQPREVTGARKSGPYLKLLCHQCAVSPHANPSCLSAVPLPSAFWRMSDEMRWLEIGERKSISSTLPPCVEW